MPTRRRLTEYLSLTEITNRHLETLAEFISQKSRGRITTPELTGNVSQKAARDSFRLGKRPYELLTISIATPSS
ncbi:MAG: hypothetical protein LBK41_01440 [Clostridiales bacterium]|nr:hypothetical protein [Clostridiales bacterium]